MALILRTPNIFQTFGKFIEDITIFNRSIIVKEQNILQLIELQLVKLSITEPLNLA